MKPSKEDRKEISQVQSELETGLQLVKCRQCGCMGGALDRFAQQLPGLPGKEASDLAGKVADWKAQMKPIRYACLGCEHCFPAVAENSFAAAFPDATHPPALACGFQTNEEKWPAVVGEYFVLNSSAPVAVATLASIQLAEELAHLKPVGLGLVGKLETENIGIDKIVKNTISNPAIRFIIVAGLEPVGHHSGSALLALYQNGVDDNNRVLGSTAKRPVLRNVTSAEIDAFRKQVQIVDLLGCEDPVEITNRVTELVSAAKAGGLLLGQSTNQKSFIQQAQQNTLKDLTLCADSQCACHQEPTDSLSTIVVENTGKEIILDKAGYFVVLPVVERNLINVEHYAYDNTLLHIIEGPNARSLYLAIIDHGWITELSHAAYLGKELARAELSTQGGFKYVQDGA